MLFGEILKNKGLVTDDELNKILEICSKSNKKIGEICIQEGFITEEQLVEILQEQGYNEWNGSKEELDINLIKRFDYTVLKKEGFIPLSYKDKVCSVVVVDPINIKVGTELKKELSISRIEKFITTRTNILNILKEIYKENKEYIKASSTINVDYKGNNDDYIQKLIATAVKEKSSDLHFSFNHDGSLKVEIRKFGIMVTISKMEKTKSGLFIRALKQLVGMDPDIFTSQDKGKTLYVKEIGEDVNLRCSSIPTISSKDSDKIVIRLMGTSKDIIPMNKLGYKSEHMNYIKDMAKMGEGLNLFVGSTNSGKSTTIYSILNFINNGEKNIVTVEDPVEIKLEGIHQYKVNEHNKIENILRNIVRQDPNIIYIGEMRDEITADIGIESALTGHGVWSTMHGRDSVSTIARLLDFGMSPLNISRTLNFIIYQKLVRVVCPLCKEEVKHKGEVYYNRGKGCGECNNLGIIGMTPIYELLKFNDKVKNLITSNKINEIENKVDYKIVDSIADKKDIINFEDISILLK